MNWSGHGLMDLTGYGAYLDGKLSDAELTEQTLRESLRSLEGLPIPPVL